MLLTVPGMPEFLRGEHERAGAAFDAAGRRGDALHDVGRAALAAFVPQAVVRDAARAAFFFVLLVAALGQVVACSSSSGSSKSSQSFP